MTKSLLLGLTALVVVVGAAALAWQSYTPPSTSETTAAQVADAPSAREIFPKVLNR
jgi:hypothetical protein